MSGLPPYGGGGSREVVMGDDWPECTVHNEVKWPSITSDENSVKLQYTCPMCLESSGLFEETLEDVDDDRLLDIYRHRHQANQIVEDGNEKRKRDEKRLEEEIKRRESMDLPDLSLSVLIGLSSDQKRVVEDEIYRGASQFAAANIDAETLSKDHNWVDIVGVKPDIDVSPPDEEVDTLLPASEHDAEMIVERFGDTDTEMD